MNEQSVTHAHCPICATCKGHHLPREDHIAPHQPDYVVIPRRAKSPRRDEKDHKKPARTIPIVPKASTADATGHITGV